VPGFCPGQPEKTKIIVNMFKHVEHDAEIAGWSFHVADQHAGIVQTVMAVGLARMIDGGL